MVQMLMAEPSPGRGRRFEALGPSCGFHHGMLGTTCQQRQAVYKLLQTCQEVPCGGMMNI